MTSAPFETDFFAPQSADAGPSLETLALRWSDGLGLERVLPLASGPLSIGAGPRCEARLKASGLRPLHAVASLTEQGVILHCWAGEETRLNGETFRESLLSEGDQLTVGSVHLEVIAWELEPVATPTAATPVEEPIPEAVVQEPDDVSWAVEPIEQPTSDPFALGESAEVASENETWAAEPDTEESYAEGSFSELPIPREDAQLTSDEQAETHASEVSAWESSFVKPETHVETFTVGDDASFSAPFSSDLPTENPIEPIEEGPSSDASSEFQEEPTAEDFLANNNAEATEATDEPVSEPVAEQPAWEPASELSPSIVEGSANVAQEVEAKTEGLWGIEAIAADQPLLHAPVEGEEATTAVEPEVRIDATEEEEVIQQEEEPAEEEGIDSSPLWGATQEDEEPASEPFEQQSFIEQYSHLLTEEEPVSAEEKTFGLATPPEVPAAELPQEIIPDAPEALAGNADESIDDYMQKMMARIRGEEIGEEASEIASSPSPKPLEPTAAPSSIALAPEAVAEKKAPLIDLAELKSTPTPEQQTDMNSLRNLANESARQAIGVSTTKRRREKVFVKLALAGIGGAGGVLGLVTAPDLLGTHFIGSVLLSFGAFYFGSRAMLEAQLEAQES